MSSCEGLIFRRNFSLDNNSKLEKYLHQLKIALEEFIRTNDPSRLFRQTRMLLKRSDRNPPPLNEAIQRGHTTLALSLIQQVLDMPSSDGILEEEDGNGETPLLIAAKLNHWELLEPILKNRLDLIEQKDKDGNNFLHLLASVNEKKRLETIQNVMEILPTASKIMLFKAKDKRSQMFLNIAQRHENICSVSLFNF